MPSLLLSMMMLFRIVNFKNSTFMKRRQMQHESSFFIPRVIIICYIMKQSPPGESNNFEVFSITKAVSVFYSIFHWLSTRVYLQKGIPTIGLTHFIVFILFFHLVDEISLCPLNFENSSGEYKASSE